MKKVLAVLVLLALQFLILDYENSLSYYSSLSLSLLEIASAVTKLPSAVK